MLGAQHEFQPMPYPGLANLSSQGLGTRMRWYIRGAQLSRQLCTCQSACACSRRAQRKFRERQRTRLQDSESKIAELSQHVEQLRLRMAELERTNAALQAAGAPRALDAPGPATLPSPGPSPRTGAAEAPKRELAAVPLAPGWPGSREESAVLSEDGSIVFFRQGACQRIVVSPLLHCFIPSQAACLQQQPMQRLGVHAGGDMLVRPCDVASMPWAEVKQLWCESMALLSEALAEAAGDAASPAHPQVVRHLEEIRQVRCNIMSFMPSQC